MTDAAALFDPDHPPTGETLRDEALARVAAHADSDWTVVCASWVRSLPPGREFTADDAWEATAAENAFTHEPRALGAVLRHLARRDVIVSTQRYRPSTRPACHARPVLIWRRA